MNIGNIILALLVFSFIIFFHELGHFLLAKKNNIAVNEFAIGMGPKLLSFEKNETRYSIRLLPIGGYCAMLGEDEECDDERAFGNQTVWARIAVVFAGPFFNFILAFVLSIVLVSMAGIDRPVIGQVDEDGPAYEEGVRVGDLILEYNGHKVYNSREVTVYERFDKKEEVVLKIERDGKEHTYKITPIEQDGRQLMGIRFQGRVATKFPENLKYAFYETRYNIKMVGLGLKYLVTGRVGLNGMSGPVGIVSQMSETIDEAKEATVSGGGNTKDVIINVLLNMINFCVMLSANLGFMNLLPIPALDGGRLVFLIIEALFKKRMSEDLEGKINLVFFGLLLLLMAVVMFNDVLRIFK